MTEGSAEMTEGSAGMTGGERRSDGGGHRSDGGGHRSDGGEGRALNEARPVADPTPQARSIPISRRGICVLLSHPCAPFRHSCVGRNPCDRPTPARSTMPPTAHRSVRTRDRTVPAPSNIQPTLGTPQSAWIPACAGMTEGPRPERNSARCNPPTQRSSSPHSACEIASPTNPGQARSRINRDHPIAPLRLDPGHDLIERPQHVETQQLQLVPDARPAQRTPSQTRTPQARSIPISRRGICVLLSHPCAPFRHSCVGRNPCDRPTPARSTMPPTAHRTVRTRDRTVPAPSNIQPTLGTPQSAWIPACAGMTEGSAGVTEGSAGATEGGTGATEGGAGMTEGSAGMTEGGAG